jgi:signal peptidase I
MGRSPTSRRSSVTLQQNNEALQQRLDSLVPIETPELSRNALYLDRSVQNVTYTGAVCSGSMEPNITCNDLLILYRASVTDLNTGDIIYFRRQKPDCSGPLEGRFMLHRISRVIAASSGLEFETKGDALPAPDACLVPAQDVLYKLLTNVRSARIPG